MCDVNELINKPESKTFDRKSSRIAPKDLAKILIAFANADGGEVVIGIDDKKLEGVNKIDSHKLNDLEQVGMEHIKPTLYTEKTELNITLENGKEDKLLIFKVEPGDGIVYMNNKDEVFLRNGDESKKLTYNQREQLEMDKGIRIYEKRPVNDAVLEDLDLDTLEKYRNIYGFTGDNIWDLLFPKGLANRSRNNNGAMEYRLNVAGVLLLAKTPTAFFPGARVRFIRYEGIEEKVGTSMNVVKQSFIEGPLDKMLQNIKDELTSQLRVFTSLDSDTGKFKDIPEYPSEAWLEGVVNALTHRAYNLDGDDIRIKMFDDKLVIHSPGSLPSVVNTENIRTTHYSRNPIIARALTDFGWVKEFGEGVDRIYKEMNELFLEDPEYKTDTVMTELILYNNIKTRQGRRNENLLDSIGAEVWDELNFVERKVVKLSFENDQIRIKDVMETFNVTKGVARSTLKKLTEKNILTLYATSRQDPTQYYSLTSIKD